MPRYQRALHQKLIKERLARLHLCLSLSLAPLLLVLALPGALAVELRLANADASKLHRRTRTLVGKRCAQQMHFGLELGEPPNHRVGGRKVASRGHDSRCMPDGTAARLHISLSGNCAVGSRIGRQFRSAPVLSVGVGVGVGVLGMDVGVGVRLGIGVGVFGGAEGGVGVRLGMGVGVGVLGMGVGVGVGV